MNISEYQKKAITTDQNDRAIGAAINVTPLGLVGEVGSLASVYKKYLRDGAGYKNYDKHIIEELGDTLWYVASLAHAYGIKLGPISKKKKIAHFKELDLQNMDRLIEISSELFHDRRTKKHLTPTKKKNLLDEAVEVIQEIALSVDTTLEFVMQENLYKTARRWGSKNERKKKSKAPIFDGNCPPEERLLRNFRLDITESHITKKAGRKTTKKTIARMRIKGLNIGDPLTDNSEVDDHYRFHDVFHLANVAVLGWSPVFRALLKAKRKSDPKADEAQDGARAIIVEEAIVFQIFNYARPKGFLKGVTRVDHDLLKLIRELSSDLEIKDIAEWEWELAILEGCKAFRHLKSKKKGSLFINSDKRRIDLTK